jgi:hypothetical protein
MDCVAHDITSRQATTMIPVQETLSRREIAGSTKADPVLSVVSQPDRTDPPEAVRSYAPGPDLDPEMNYLR